MSHPTAREDLVREIEELRRREAERQALEAEHGRTVRDLRERVKELNCLYAISRLLWREVPGARWALLADSPLMFGLLRMVHALLSTAEQDRLGLFRDFEEACHWLLGQVVPDPVHPQPGWSWSHA